MTVTNWVQAGISKYIRANTVETRSFTVQGGTWRRSRLAVSPIRIEKRSRSDRAGGERVK